MPDATSTPRTVDPADLPTLSVVVVARDEADRIADCLASVVTAVEPFDAEVVVVDSNSRDDTVARAADFPVSVLRIPTDEISTPAAGRYVGAKFAAGEQVLFVDGDVTLDSGWLTPAAALLADCPELAGVGGVLTPVTSDARNRPEPTAAESTDRLEGVALYDADALAAVGGYDPFLRSREEVQLGMAFADAGFDLVRLPQVVGEHPATERESLLREPLRRWRQGFFHGVADALLRSAPSPRRTAVHVRDHRYALLAGGWLAVGLVSVASLPALACWTAATLASVAAVARSRGPGRTYALVTAWLALWLAVLTHGWQEPPQPDSFPLERVEVVDIGPRLESVADAGVGDRFQPDQRSGLGSIPPSSAVEFDPPTSDSSSSTSGSMSAERDESTYGE